MANEIKKGTQSDNDVWVLHRTKDIKALVNAVQSITQSVIAHPHYEIDSEFDDRVSDCQEALKPFVKQKKDE